MANKQIAHYLKLNDLELRNVIVERYARRQNSPKEAIDRFINLPAELMPTINDIDTAFKGHIKSANHYTAPINESSSTCTKLYK